MYNPPIHLEDLEKPEMPTLAHPGRRFVARCLDLFPVVVFVIFTVCMIAGAGSFHPGEDHHMYYGIFYAGCAAITIFEIVQFIILVRSGQTLGKKIMQIQIVQFPNYGRVSACPILFREILCKLAALEFLAMTAFAPLAYYVALLVYSIPGLPTILQILVPLFQVLDPLFIFGNKHRCLHDLIAGTVVVDA